MKLIPEIRRVH